MAEGADDTSELRTDDGGTDLERRLRPAVTLVSAWVAQLAKDQRIDTEPARHPRPTSSPCSAVSRTPGWPPAGGPKCSEMT